MHIKLGFVRRNALSKIALAVVVALTTLMVSQAQAAVSCHKINAKGIGKDLGDGESDISIIGGGLLHGTVEGFYEVTDFDGESVFTVAGTSVFTTNGGTLTVTAEGTVDVDFDPDTGEAITGESDVSGTVVDATEKLAGATGAVRFVGIEDFLTGNILLDKLTGEICVDLRP